MTSVFAMAGVTKEVPEEVDSLRHWTSLMYSSRLMGEAFFGRAPVTDLRCLSNFLVGVLVNETSTSFPRSTFS